VAAEALSSDDGCIMKVDEKPAPQADDAARRQQLREFLIGCRSRLRPVQVGLPGTPGRRVPGLRRGEVAELVGVSDDWYRWFESGRDVRVSPQFVARLAKALRLSASEELTAYCLAFREIYRAHSALGTPLLSPAAAA
jgi:hypothetical protein